MYWGKKVCNKVVARFLVFTLVIAMLIPAGEVFAQTKISDIKGHWAETVIEKWIANEMIKGYSDSTFKPDKPITRSEFITLVNKAMAFKDKKTADFKDVKASDWYYEQLEIALGANYLSGFSDGTFRPNDLVTREQAANIVAKIKGLQDDEATANKFSDSSTISAWAKGKIGAVVKAGFMTGYPNNTFAPKDSLSRAQAVVILDRLISNNDYVIKEAGTKLADKTIEGNLIIDKSVGDGEVFLENVIVKGTTYIYGGGKSSIHFVDCDLYDVFVDKENGVVRVVFEGTTDANKVSLLSQVLLGLKDKAVIDNLDISENALKSIIDLAKDTRIDEIVINADSIQIIGNGTIYSITNNGKDNKSDIKPVIGQITGGGGAGGGGSAGGGGGTPSTVPVTGIALNQTTANMKAGQTLQLTATITPTNATNKTVEWTSSDTTVATVDQNGNINAIKAGIAIITATTVDGGKTATCEVTITPNTQIYKISIYNPPTELIVGDSVTLKVTYNDTGNFITDNLQWSSNNSECITVDNNGTITALKPGIANIQVGIPSSTKPITDSCNITVVSGIKTITNSTDLLEAIANAEGGEELILEGTLGDEDNYTIYNITKPLIIKSTTNAMVYGSFIINTEGARIEGLTIQNKYVDGNDSASKNAINIYADWVEINNNTIKTAPSAENYEPNGIVVFKKNENPASINIYENKLIGYNNATTDKMYMSAGIFVAEDYPMFRKPFFGITDETVKSAKYSEDTFDDVNDFENCAYAYVRMSGFDFSKPAVGQTVECALVQNADALQNAVKYAKDDAIIMISGGTYDLTPTTDMIQGQSGWYLPIIKNGIKLIGINDPVLTSSTTAPNGCWATQNLITVWGDNVVFDGLTITPKSEVNKSIEFVGDIDVTVKNCTFMPIPTSVLAGADQTKGGSLYFNGAGIDGTNTITVINNTFNYTSVAFDGVVAGSIQVKDNTWDNVEVYAIGNTYWGDPSRKTTQYTDVIITGNNFNNAIGSAKVITARLNQSFILDTTNKVNGTAITAESFAPYVNYNNLTNLPECKNNKVFVNGILIPNPYLDIDYYVTNVEQLLNCISIAKENDTIKVAQGTYETNLTISKNITILGSGKDKTIIKGHLTQTNGTVKDLTLTNESNTQLLLIGNTAEANITMTNVKVQFPIFTAEDGIAQNDRKTLAYVLSGNNATINIDSCQFINDAVNSVTENAPQWSYGLYMNVQGANGRFNFTNSSFNGAFRTMLPNVNGVANISNNTFVNSVFSVVNGPTNGAMGEATCITTDKVNSNVTINSNTFINAGAFYFQVIASVNNNTFNFENLNLLHYIQLKGGLTGLDLRDNSFVTAGNVVYLYGPQDSIQLPIGTKYIGFKYNGSRWVEWDGNTAVDTVESLIRAINNSNSGDLIYVAAGMYNVGTGINIPIGVTVQGQDKNLVELISSDTTTNQTTVTLSGTLEDVTVAYKPSRVPGTAWGTENPAGVTILENGTLRDCKVTGHRNGVYANNVIGITISGNEICANRTGIQFANAVGGTVNNNSIHDNETIGILLQWLSANNGSIPTFDGNIISNNWSSDFENRWPTEHVVNLNSNNFNAEPVTLTVAPNSSEGSSQKTFTKEEIVFIANIVTSNINNIIKDNIEVKNTAYITSNGITTYYKSIQEAIDAANNNDIVSLSDGLYVVNNRINVNKPITIKGATNFGSKIVTFGSNEVFNITSNAVIDGIYIEKLDKSDQHLITIASDNVKVINSKFEGRYVIGDSEVSRAIVPNAGTRGFEITNNIFTSLRQPAYLEGEGRVYNNLVTGTKGWVVCVNYLVDFKNNSFNNNVVDIAIIANNQTTSENYTNVEIISAENNGAYVENQLLGISARDGKLLVNQSITSKAITNLDYETKNATQARIGSNAIANSNFGGTNNKSFIITDSFGNSIPVVLNWDIPLNEYVTTPAAAVGSAVESIIQDYFYAKGGTDGLMNRTLCASGYGDKFYIGSFATGSSTQISISGDNASYFFDTLQAAGTDDDTSLNRTFIINDGLNSVTICFQYKYNVITDLINDLNYMLSQTSVRVEAEKVDETHFRLVAKDVGVQIIIDGPDKADFFDTFISQ